MGGNYFEKAAYAGIALAGLVYAGTTLYNRAPSGAEKLGREVLGVLSECTEVRVTSDHYKNGLPVSGIVFCADSDQDAPNNDLFNFKESKPATPLITINTTGRKT